MSRGRCLNVKRTVLKCQDIRGKCRYILSISNILREGKILGILPLSKGEKVEQCSTIQMEEITLIWVCVKCGYFEFLPIWNFDYTGFACSECNWEGKGDGGYYRKITDDEMRMFKDCDERLGQIMFLFPYIESLSKRRKAR